MTMEGGLAAERMREESVESRNRMSEANASTSTLAPQQTLATASTHGGIVVLDFGGQYTQLIARRIREQEVFSAILPCTTPLEEIRKLEPAGVVLSGGPSSVYDAGAPVCDPKVAELGVPVLGICYGMQWLTHTFGGKVERAERREYGPAQLDTEGGSRLFRGIPPRLKTWASHGDHVVGLPGGFEVTGRTGSAVAAVEDRGRKLYGVQFHPEVRHTERGTELLRNFIFEICGAKKNWTRAGFIASTIEAVRAQAEGARAICALSGGVDSAVAAALVHRAIGDRLVNIFVDNGLLRRNEFQDTLRLLRERLGLNVMGVDAAARFLERLRGIVDPEQKRKRIGAEFIRVFEGESAKLGNVTFLAQGTLYPDVIESKSHDTAAAQTIKTHHNVGGLPEDLRFQLVEPLRYLFKDEVRAIGAELGLPEDWVWRHPFPGPGLAIRVIGAITEDRLATLRAADAIFIEELRMAGLYRTIGQAFAVLTPIRSVGVMGDYRTYAHVVALRAVTTGDFMTADWARLPYDLLGRAANRIVNEIPAVNRVAFDITSKPPATIEWE